MIYVILICAFSCLGMVVAAVLRPEMRIRSVRMSTYWMMTSVGALLLILFRFISIGDVHTGLTGDGSINPVKILLLFISMTLLSIFLDETGFFRYLANAVLRRSGSGQMKLFTAFFITISVLTIFTSNDIIILTFTPFICYFAKNAKIDPVPYLIMEFVAANTASMLLIIGNPTNIYLATSHGIDFIDYLSVMALPTVAAVIAAYIMLFFLFRKKLRSPISASVTDATIEQKTLLTIGLLLLSVCTVMLALSSYLNIEMYLVASVSALILFVLALIASIVSRRSPEELGRTLKRVPWGIVPFVISMFILVLALEKVGATADLGGLFGDDNVFVYGFASALFSNAINNIPMSVLFTSITIGAGGSPSIVYASVIGSNIGAFLTPIGALAGILWLSILKDNGIDFSFMRFVRYGVIVVIPVLSAALIGLALVT
jgi:arsenical pump membrane protein